MDELLHHCLRELAFEGDFGSNVSRLRDFILDFYAQTGTSSHTQNPDDAFCSFVWSLVVQQPTVLIGLIPPGLTSEVWIAPQTSAKRKAKFLGVEHIETSPSKLDPITDPKSTPLDLLRQAYGERLRIAAEPESIFSAITGTHIRSSKMSPMVYSALQIITRGRDTGVTVVELGRQSGYDQKTCFYLVRQLTELDLVVKVRRGGVGTHFCIHKYFFSRNLSWKAIRDEEIEAETLKLSKLMGESDLVEDEEVQGSQPLTFTPIDARHLSSLPLISARVVRLLKASKNHIHASNNMLITLGFSNPTKTDRRFFQSRIREMIQQRIIEKVIVPNNKKKVPNTVVKCFRLVEDVPAPLLDSAVVISDFEDDIEDNYPVQYGVKMDITIHKQIINLLEGSGTRGMTLNELSHSLCHFDKRTIELLLARADKFHPPSHLSDLSIAGLMETSGRERRHRYYTVANYYKLVSEEALDNSTAYFTDTDLVNIGRFYAIRSDSFYENDEELVHRQDVAKDSEPIQGQELKEEKTSVSNVLSKRDRPRKPSIKGKKLDGNQGNSSTKRKRKASSLARDEPETSGSNEPLVKRRRIDGTGLGAIGTKRGKPAKDKDKGSNQLDMTLREKRGRSSLLTEAQDLLVPSSIPQSDIDSDLDASCNVRAPTRRNSLGQDIVEHALMSVSMPNPTRQEFPQQKQHRPIIQNRGPAPSAASEEKRSVEEQRINDPVSPPSLHTETSTQNVSPARPTISLQADSITPPLPQDSALTEIPIEGYRPMITQISANTQHDGRDEPPVNTVQLLSLGSRVNVSHLRRENELLRLVESLGGIVNIQTKEFFEGHMRLLKSLAQSGEPTSAPVGTRIDKRTAVASLNSLEKKGRLKQLKTSIISHIGVNRPACIVYLPDIEQSKLDSFLADLAHGSQAAVPHIDSFVRINEPVEYGASNSTSTVRAALPLQLLLERPVNNGKERWSKNMNRANQLFAYDDATIHDVFLSERTTVGQLYGFIMGKALRCRELHLATLKMFETGSSSPHIVSVEKRIVDFSFFCHDITLALHCSIVSSLSHDEELTNFLATEEGRNTLVQDLPSTLHSLLQIGRSRSRSRFLDLLDVLRSLNLVTPLQPSDSHTPFITCLPNGEHPTAFEQLTQDKHSTEGTVAVPNYWYFPESAPLHIWAASDTHPPFWKHAKIATYVDGLTYWKDLHEACANLPSDISAQPLYQTPSPTTNITIARSLRRTFSWKADYYFTWHQIQYLKQFIKVPSTTAPLNGADAQAEHNQVQKLCHVTSAPRGAVERYLSTARDNLSKVQRKFKSRQGVEVRKRNQETKALLAKKAEEARKHREEEWQILLQKNRPDTLIDGAAVRIERIRNRFLQAGSIKDLKWEKEIQAALREADLASTKMPKLAKRTTLNIGQLPTAPIGTQTTLVAPPEISIQTLIALQGPSIKTSTKEKPKRKRKRDESNADEHLEEPRKPLRRHRFQWNPDFDELAKDASAIIRARCRGLPRLDWAAFEQAFPAVPRNTVRQRLSTIRETPANEAYLRRLEDNWYDLWMKHKGTPHLPDDDDRSPSNFDLITHLEFLRSNVDKNALRVGFAQATEASNLSIPADIEQLQDSFNILDAERTAPDWDFMWNALIEEGREKKLKQMPLSRCPEQLPCSITGENDKILIAEAALKMAMGTPSESYDSEQASWLLRSKGEDVINTATRNLLSRSILSKSQRDPTKQAPGRQLKISEINQNAIGGSISPDIFQDASSLMDVIESSDATWHEWPLTATDGDCAALLQLVSENKVEFKVDTSLPRAARAALDWNSKKADDDQIETAITVCYHRNSEIQEIIVDDFPTLLPTRFYISPDNPTSPATGIEDDGHGVTIEGNPACCRRLVLLGLVDCAACLNEAWSVFIQHLSPEEKDDAQWVIETVHQAGAAGVRKSQLMASTAFSRLKTPLTVHQMVEASIPQVYWTGYESLVLVSAHFIAKWSVIVTKDPISNLFPRRWLDIRGNKVPCFWQAALRAVMGSVIFRPGISQAEIRWRLRSVYDRQEVTELLWFLQAEGYLQYRMGPTLRCEPSAPFDEEEEGCVYWFDMDKHWYQV